MGWKLLILPSLGLLEYILLYPSMLEAVKSLI